jgi:hypothetical protein
VVTQVLWRFRSLRTFFGLDNDYIQNVYEQFFLLKYHGGWSFMEAYSLPIKIRQWFLDRLSNQIEKENEAMEEAQQKGSR